MQLNLNFWQIAQVFSQMPELIYLQQEDKIKTLIKQVNPIIIDFLQDKELFYEILNLEVEEAKELLPYILATSESSNSLLSLIKKLNPNLIFGDKSLPQEFNNFLSFSLLYFGKLNDLKEVIVSIANSTKIDESVQSYSDFALEYATLIEANQPSKIKASKSLRESLGI